MIIIFKKDSLNFDLFWQKNVFVKFSDENDGNVETVLPSVFSPSTEEDIKTSPSMKTWNEFPHFPDQVLTSIKKAHSCFN